jgi:hypothetical protein
VRPTCASAAARYKIAFSLPPALADEADQADQVSITVDPAEKAAASPVVLEIRECRSDLSTVLTVTSTAAAAPGALRNVAAERAAPAEKTDTYRETLDMPGHWRSGERAPITFARFVP